MNEKTQAELQKGYVAKQRKIEGDRKAFEKRKEDAEKSWDSLRMSFGRRRARKEFRKFFGSNLSEIVNREFFVKDLLKTK